jgi:hypothetical protein
MPKKKVNIRTRNVEHPNLPNFNWRKERKVFVEHMTEKLSRGVQISTLYDKYIEINSIYSKEDTHYLESLKSTIWNPKDIENYQQTIEEIKTLKPTLVVCDNSTEWNHMRRMVSTMEYSQGVGRRIKFYMTDEVSGKILGIAEIASDFGELGVRDRYIGWTRENKYQDGKLKHTCVGATIVPVGVLGFNFIGGKLLSLLLTSKLVREAWEEKYGDKLVGIGTTSLYGHKKGGSQYSGLNPIWKSLGHTEGKVIMKPDSKIYRRCTSWLKQFFRLEYDVAMNQSRPKQRVLSLICSKLGIIHSSLQHGFKRGVYFSEFYTDSKEFLRDEIDEVTQTKFDDSVESLVSRWCRKAIKRYKRLIETNKLRDHVLYYLDILGKSWRQVLKSCLGIIEVRLANNFLSLIPSSARNQLRVHLKRFWQCFTPFKVLEFIYFKSFIRAKFILYLRSLTS